MLWQSHLAMRWALRLGNLVGEITSVCLTSDLIINRLRYRKTLHQGPLKPQFRPVVEKSHGLWAKVVSRDDQRPREVQIDLSYRLSPSQLRELVTLPIPITKRVTVS